MASLPDAHAVAPDPSPHDAEAWYRRGAAALAQDDLAAAEAALWTCLAGDGQHAAALHLLGRLRERQGQPEAALALQLQSWLHGPGLGWNAFAAAELHSRAQRWGEAAAAYRAALDVLPEESWIEPLLHRQEGLARLGGERLRDGFSDNAYRVWCQGFEPPLSASPGEPDSLPPDWHLDRDTATVLRPGALAWLRSWLAKQGAEADLLSCDEDRLDAGGRRLDPWFKPGWVTESFWSTPWLGSGAFWRRSWLQRCGLWPPPDPGDPLARWRWQLMALEQQPRRLHLARILLHRKPLGRGGQQPEAPSTDQVASLAAGLNTWPMARRLADRPLQQQLGPPVTAATGPGGNAALAAAQAAALAEHLGRSGEGTVAVLALPPAPASAAAGTGAGDVARADPCFQLIWAIPARTRLSVVVLSRDRPDLLRRCLYSVEASRDGGIDLEWILVDNGSRLEATASLLRHWRQRPGSRVRVLTLDQPFNWSLLNNRAAASSRAELLLFLNNDIEVPPSSRDGWLTAMAGQARRPAIGCVGARLLYPDGSLQHAGLLPPLGQGCEHPYRHLRLERLPHRGRAAHLSGWPALTGACLMLRRSLWQCSGGFDAALPVEGNDVDFCLRLGRLGLRHVVCPEATLLHHEGASRPLARSGTWAPAQALLRRRWPNAMASAAPWWPAACGLDEVDGRPRELAGRGWL